MGIQTRSGARRRIRVRRQSNFLSTAPITIDRAMTMEWLADGQEIEQYSIEAFAGREMDDAAQRHIRWT